MKRALIAAVAIMVACAPPPPGPGPEADSQTRHMANIIANNVFFYYENIEPAATFYCSGSAGR